MKKAKYEEGTLFQNNRTGKFFCLGSSWFNDKKKEYCYDAFYINDYDERGEIKTRRYWQSRLDKEFKKVPDSSLIKLLYGKN